MATIMMLFSLRSVVASFLFFFCFITTSTALSSTANTNNRVAVVTGASRGIGRGIALELGSEGYTVYCLGRSSRVQTDILLEQQQQRPVSSDLDCTVESAAEQVSQRGGHGIAMPCDLRDDTVIDELLQTVFDEQGRLDVLVCSAYTTPPKNLRGDFWTQGMDMWDAVNHVGLRQVYAACRAGAPYMIQTAKEQTTMTPLICLISSFGGKSYTFNVAYGIGKAAIDRMAVDMSYQLKKHKVATISLYPGLVKTEANLQMELDGTWAEASGNLDLSQGETPAFSGRAVAALSNLKGDALLQRSGQVEVVAELAKELDFTDTDGIQPPSIRSLQYLLPNFVFPQVEREMKKPIPDWIRNNVPDYLVPWSTFSSGPPPEMDTR